MLSTDQCKPVLPVLLDMSIALGQIYFSLGWKAFFTYLITFLNGFSQICNNAPRKCLLLLSRVPHVSLFRPLVYSMFTSPFGILSQRYIDKYHLYTNDTELYILLDPENNLISPLSKRIYDIILLIFGNQRLKILKMLFIRLHQIILNR